VIDGESEGGDCDVVIRYDTIEEFNVESVCVLMIDVDIS